MADASTPRIVRLRRLERPALTGVLVREVVNFSSYWRSSTFSSTVEPTIYLLAFGFGFGALVGTVGGYDYVEFVGTGTVATAVLFSSAFPAMFGTFVKYQFQRTYDAILAAPVDTEELVTAEAIWIATRAGVYGCVPMLVAMVFGLDPAWGMLTVPGIAFVAGYGWACFGISIAGFASSFEIFNYVVSAVLTPLFLVAGTFFPIDQLPEWAQALANLNPLLTWSSSFATPCSGSKGGRTRSAGLPRRLRVGHVADRDLRDDAQARRLALRLLQPALVDGQDDLAEAVGGIQALVRRRRLSEREDAVHHGTPTRLRDVPEERVELAWAAHGRALDPNPREEDPASSTSATSPAVSPKLTSRPPGRSARRAPGQLAPPTLSTTASTGPSRSGQSSSR